MWGALLFPGIAIGLWLWAPWNEPEVVHDLNGGAWYRIKGGDGVQQSVEACVKHHGDRQMVPGLLPTDGEHSWTFCCAPRGAPVCEAICDKPAGNRVK
jgi:hypothetical protein